MTDLKEDTSIFFLAKTLHVVAILFETFFTANNNK